MNSEATLSLIIKAKDLASRELQGLNTQLGKTTKDGLGGLGLGFLGAAGAAAILVGGLSDAVKGAAEEQAAMAKLDAALKANVDHWDGNKAAIDKAIEAGINLGFTDDEQVTSLSKLIVATHNVNEAIDIQRVAMDLARLKGVDLASATDALTRVEGGQYRALKSMGIVLKDNATQQDALNAVTAAASGQASAYADTLDGKVAIANAKYKDSMDKLGAQAIPVVTQAVDILNWTFENGIGVNQWSQRVVQGFQKTDAAAIGTSGRIHDFEGDISTDLKAAVQAGTNHLGDFRVGLSLTGKAALDVVNNMIDMEREMAYISTVGHQRRTGNPQTPPKPKPKPKPIEHAVGHAQGGWVGLNGPELSWVGERGPEYIVPNNQLGRGGGVTIQGVTEADIGRMIDRHMYFRLQRAPRRT